MNAQRKNPKIIARRTSETRKAAASSQDTQALLHELQTRRVELEMQNDELRRSQRELEEMRQRYVHLYNFAPVGYLMLDRKGVVHSINLMGSRMLGREQRSLERLPFSTCIAREDKKIFFAHLKEVFSDEEVRTCQLRITRKDKIIVYVELRSIVSAEYERGHSRCLTSLTDITDRKRIEEALRTSKKRLQVAISASIRGIWEWDLQTNAIFWSPETFEIFGVQTSTGTLKSFTRLLHPDDADRVMAAGREAVDGKKTYREEFRIIRPDGRVLWISSVAKTEYDDAGKPLRLIGTVQDITERKNLEAEVALREQWLNAFFSGATAGLVLIDKNLRYVKINDTLAEMNGLPASEHIGRTVREVLPELAPIVEPIFRKVLATGEPTSNIEVAGETPKHQGIHRHWIESFFPIAGPDRRPEGVGAIVVEITAQKQAEEAARQYAKEIEETNNALKVLLKQRESDRRELEEKVLANVKQIILPYVEILKKSMRKNPADAMHLNILEKNIQGITSSFAVSLSHKLTALTPKEILIADLVKEGRTDKDISETLSLSINTVKAHRRNIRKKLGLAGEKTNLRTFLSSIDNRYDS